MKPMKALVAAAVITILVQACGGGGGSDNATSSSAVSQASQLSPASVAAVPSTGPAVGTTAVVIAPAELTPPINRQMADQKDLISGPQVHFVYAVPSDGTDRAFDLSPSMTNSTGSWNNWLRGKTGGRGFRLDLITANTLDITYVRLTVTDAQLESFGQRKRDQIEVEVAKQLPQISNKLYAVYYEGTNPRTCADAPHPPQLPGRTVVMYLKGGVAGSPPCAGNPFAASPTSPPGYIDFAMLHELVHAQGFVDVNAPDQTLNGHVSTDPSDLMYAGPLPWTPSKLDVNGRNYYNPAGITNGLVNLANSGYLNTQ